MGGSMAADMAVGERGTREEGGDVSTTNTMTPRRRPRHWQISPSAFFPGRISWLYSLPSRGSHLLRSSVTGTIDVISLRSLESVCGVSQRDRLRE